MLQLVQLGAADTPEAVKSMDLDFGRPFPPPYGVHVTSGWEDGRGHPGLDIQASVGTPVLAIQDGVVITADSEGGGDAGKWVAIQHAHGWVSRSMHFSKVTVKKGQVVRKGQQIGLSGNTGKSSGPHLHLDFKLLPEWLPAIQREIGKWGPAGYKATMNGRDGVPGEPWVPADSYRQDVIDRARRNNVPLYAERLKARHEAEVAAVYASGWWGPALIGIGALALGAGAFFWMSGASTSSSYGRRRRWGI